MAYAIVFGLLVPLMALTQEASKDRAAKTPNIVFIVVDDLGWADVGYQAVPSTRPRISIVWPSIVYNSPMPTRLPRYVALPGPPC